MLCALSGEAPLHPVVSTKSAQLFEKHLIEKYIADNGRDPITGEAMTSSDLLELKVSTMVKPRPPQSASIPSMLSVFQKEWDAVMLETFTLREQLEKVRQELAHSLYQHEAACRVIARLISERDDARRQLANIQAAGLASAAAVAASAPAASGSAAATPSKAGDEMDVDEAPREGQGIPVRVIEDLNATAKELSQVRKKRTVPDDLTTPEQISHFKTTHPLTGLHAGSAPGILALDIHRNGNLILTGGADKQAVVYDIKDAAIAHTLKGHSKKVTDVVFHPSKESIFTCSADKTVRLWNMEGAKGYKAHVVKAHEDEVSAISLHCTGNYLVSASLDSTWNFIDIASGVVFSKVSAPEVVKKGYTKVEFHPDGLILGTGTTDSMIRVWDVKSQANVASFEGHRGKITGLSFSENGYYLATSAEDTTVKIWDLRKLKSIHTIELGEAVTTNAVSFDYSGSYLAVGGSDVRVYQAKAWTELLRLSEHKAPVTDVQFDHGTRMLASVSLDRSLNIYSA